MKPWRAVPLQIAVLTVLGVTAITAYLYERGGLAETSVMQAPAPSATPEAASGAEKPEEAKEERFDKDAGAADKKLILLGKKYAPESPASGSAAEPKARPMGGRQAEIPARDEMVAAKAKTAKQSASRAASKPTTAPSSPAPAAPMLQAPPATDAPPQANPQVVAEIRHRARAPAEAAAQPKSAAPPESDALFMAEASPAAKRDAFRSEAFESESQVSGNMAPARRENDGAGLAAAPSKGRAKAETAEVPARQPAQDTAGFTVQARNAKDTTALLSGLKAMGVEIQTREPGEPGRYVLRVPASMLKDILPYLERYGKSARQGASPATAPESPVRVRLRIDLPVP
jgi:hypothetical protein